MDVYNRVKMLVLVCHIFEQNLPCLQPLLYNNLQKKPQKNGEQNTMKQII